MKRINLIYTLLMALLIACQPKQDQQETTESESEELTAIEAPKAHHSATISKILAAHGGFDKWSGMQQLSYTKGEEKTITNLKNRKILLEAPTQTIGFDGENVWQTPDSLDASRARFYHNLYFYFYAMPFVLGDPGVYYEDTEPMEIKGKTYNGVKISFGDEVGDAPEDNYIVWYDADTYQMEWLMYTVTYTSGQSSDDYRLIKYSIWDEFSGLRLPVKLQWFEYKDGRIGNSMRSVNFADTKLSEEAPSEDLFAMPENATIAPLLVKN